MRKFILLLFASALRAQQGSLIHGTRLTSPADSSLFWCTDSIKTLTRVCNFATIQKRLAFKSFDSLVTTKLNLTGATITGVPTWSSAQGITIAGGAAAQPNITSISPVTGLTVGGANASIRLGGATASFPAIFRASTTLQFRLADSSAATDISAGNANLGGNLNAFSGNVVAGSTGIFQWQSRTQLSSAGDGQAKAQNAAGTAPAWFSTGLAYQAFDTTVTSLTGVNPDFTKRSFFGVIINANVGDTLRAPTFPAGASATNLTIVAVRVKNTSGGAITTAPVWNTVYHFGSGGTPAQPASATHLIIWFVTDGTTLWEIMRTTGLAN